MQYREFNYPVKRQCINPLIKGAAIGLAIEFAVVGLLTGLAMLIFTFLARVPSR